jgi:hypothetical protein
MVCVMFDYLTKDYLTKDYLTKDYLTKDYLTKDYLTKDYLTKDYPTVPGGGVKVRTRWSLLVLWAIFILAGCARTAAPFTDDFSDPASGWGAASHETYVRGYQQGRYLMQIDASQLLVWVASGRAFDDVTVDVTVRSEGVTDNHYGVFCRYTEGEFYYFAISTDGYYAIFRRDADGELQSLTGEGMLRSSLVRLDGSENRLRAVCDGNQLSLYINGERAAQVNDDTLTRGDIGMAAGTLRQGGTIVWFDDLEVDRP